MPTCLFMFLVSLCFVAGAVFLYFTVGRVPRFEGPVNRLYPGVLWSPCGMRMYAVLENGTVHKYELASPYDWSKSTYVGTVTQEDIERAAIPETDTRATAHTEQVRNEPQD